MRVANSARQPSLATCADVTVSPGRSKLSLKTVQNIGLGHHIVHRIGEAWVTSVIGDTFAHDFGPAQRIWRLGCASGEPPKRKPLGSIFFVTEAAFLKIAGLPVGGNRCPPQGSIGLDDIAKMPTQHHVVDAVGKVRIAILEYLQPDQKASEVVGREPDFAWFVGVVDLCSRPGVIDLVWQFSPEEFKLLEAGQDLKQARIERIPVDEAKLMGGNDAADIGGRIPHGC